MSAKRYLLTMSCVYQLGVVSGNFVSPDWELYLLGCECWLELWECWLCEGSEGSLLLLLSVCWEEAAPGQLSLASPACWPTPHRLGVGLSKNYTGYCNTPAHMYNVYTPPLSLSHTDITLSLPYHHLKLIHSKQAPAPTRRPPSQGRGRAWLCL